MASRQIKDELLQEDFDFQIWVFFLVVVSVYFTCWIEFSTELKSKVVDLHLSQIQVL